jgi:hypothetical protein
MEFDGEDRLDIEERFMHDFEALKKAINDTWRRNRVLSVSLVLQNARPLA